MERFPGERLERKRRAGVAGGGVRWWCVRAHTLLLLGGLTNFTKRFALVRNNVS